MSTSKQTSCFGRNTAGETDIPPGYKSGVDIIVTGRIHTCMVLSGEVECFGNNSEGQTDTTGWKRNVHLMAAGDRYTCVKKIGIASKCWGSWKNGQLDIPKKFEFD